MELNKVLQDKKELELTVNTKGGQLLLKEIKGKINNTTNTLLNNYKKLEHFELISLISELDANKKLYDKLSNLKEEIETLSKEI